MAQIQDFLNSRSCPLCKSNLDYNVKESKLTCKNPECKKQYPVEDGIPIMLVEE